MVPRENVDKGVGMNYWETNNGHDFGRMFLRELKEINRTLNKKKEQQLVTICNVPDSIKKLNDDLANGWRIVHMSSNGNIITLVLEREVKNDEE